MIRPATETQLDYFYQLSEQSADSTLTLSQLQHYLNNSGLVAIDHEQQIVGFVAFRHVGDEAELDQILVDPSFRRLGLAKAALQHWQSQLLAKGVSVIFLDVRRGNVPAYQLYLQLGYTIVGERKGYYQHGGQPEDALLMKLTLLAGLE